MPSPRWLSLKQMRRLSLIPLLCVAAPWACDQGIIDPGNQDAGKIPIEGGTSTFDVRPHNDTRSPDFLHKVDLTTKVDDPCTYGKCGKNMICMANVCKKMCDTKGCNEKTSQCSSNKACLWASTFTGACLETNAKYLQKCGQGYFCEQGTLCVRVGTKQPKCLKLCKYGCPTGAPCAQLDNGCYACIQ